MADKETKSKATAEQQAVWQIVANAPDAIHFRAWAVLAETVGPCPPELLHAVQARGRELNA